MKTFDKIIVFLITLILTFTIPVSVVADSKEFISLDAKEIVVNNKNLNVINGKYVYRILVDYSAKVLQVNIIPYNENAKISGNSVFNLTNEKEQSFLFKIELGEEFNEYSLIVNKRDETTKEKYSEIINFYENLKFFMITFILSFIIIFIIKLIIEKTKKD